MSPCARDVRRTDCAPARGLVAVCAALFSIASALPGCRDVSRFSTGDDHFEGTVVQGGFVRAGIANDARLCLTLDAHHLQDAPGRIGASDGRFHDTPLRPIPQLWHDPLSTLAFGEGRTQNLLYVASPLSVPPVGGGGATPVEGDVMVVVSLMQTGDVEVRLLRGAPDGVGAAPASGEVGAAGAAPSIFGVFPLTRAEGPCAF